MGRHARPSVGISRAALLTITAQCLGYRARNEDALPLYRAAVEDGGEVSPDARVWLADGLDKVGDADAARALFEAVPRDRPTDPDAYQAVGECWEEEGALEEARRTFTLGWTRCSESDEVDVHAALHLLVCRARVRVAQDVPGDDLDIIAQEYLRERRRERERRSGPLIQTFIPHAEWDAGPHGRPPGGSFEEQALLIERLLRDDAGPGGTICVPLDVVGLTSYAAAHELEPSEREAPIGYGERRAAAGHGVAWPPPRNEACWCGSGTKYKKCCGRPFGS